MIYVSNVRHFISIVSIDCTHFTESTWDQEGWWIIFAQDHVGFQLVLESIDVIATLGCWFKSKILYWVDFLWNKTCFIFHIHFWQIMIGLLVAFFTSSVEVLYPIHYLFFIWSWINTSICHQTDNIFFSSGNTEFCPKY